MTPVTISTLTIGEGAENVRVLLRTTVQEISGTNLTLLGFLSEDDAGRRRRDHLVITADVAEAIAAALRSVLARGLGGAEI